MIWTSGYLFGDYMYVWLTETIRFYQLENISIGFVDLQNVYFDTKFACIGQSQAELFLKSATWNAINLSHI